MRPMPASGVPADERAHVAVIELFKLTFLSRTTAEVSAGVSAYVGAGLLGFESCTYHLSRGPTAWELRSKETRCVVI